MDDDVDLVAAEPVDRFHEALQITIRNGDHAGRWRWVRYLREFRCIQDHVAPGVTVQQAEILSANHIERRGHALSRRRLLNFVTDFAPSWQRGLQARALSYAASVPVAEDTTVVGTKVE